MRIITLNLNGIRSANKKGFFEWFLTQNADILCVQEIKAQADHIATLPSLPGYYSYFSYAIKKGYSGVGIYSKVKPKEIITDLDYHLATEEGRYIALNVENLWVASLYLPSGTMGEHRQAIKFDFLDHFTHLLNTFKETIERGIICGDFNIAHKIIDLKNWRANQKHSGFLPEERAWMDKVFNQIGFVDAFRVVNPEPEQYTWWSNRGKAWEKNVGWRIDYQIVTPGLKPTIKSALIYKEKRFSDHAPLMINYDIIL